MANTTSRIAPAALKNELLNEFMIALLEAPRSFRLPPHTLELLLHHMDRFLWLKYWKEAQPISCLPYIDFLTINGSSGSFFIHIEEKPPELTEAELQRLDELVTFWKSYLSGQNRYPLPKQSSDSQE